jgi:putative peptidoglycan lipid II flippase
LFHIITKKVKTIPKDFFVLLRDTALLGIAVLVVKLIILGKEMVIARKIGVSADLDIFYLAFMVPMFMVNSVGGAFATSFLPQYVETKKTDNDINDYFSRVVWFLGGCLCLMTLLSVAVFFMLYSSGMVDFRPLYLHYICLLFPVFFFWGLCKLMESRMNVYSRFKIPAMIPCVTHIFIILLLMMDANDPVNMMVWGILIGSITEFSIFLYLSPVRFLSVFGLDKKDRAGFRRSKNSFLDVLFLRHIFQKEIQPILSQFYPMIGGMLLLGGTTIIDNIMAKSLGDGAVSELSYAVKITSAFGALGVMVMGITVFPYFAKKMSDQRLNLAFKKSFFMVMAMLLAILSFITALFMLFSYDIIQLIFEGGVFSAKDTASVASIQRLYMLQIPFFIIGVVASRLIAAAQRNHILMYVSAISLILNIIGNFTFMQWYGVAGIALSTSLMYTISGVTMCVYIAKRL